MMRRSIAPLFCFRGYFMKPDFPLKIDTLLHKRNEQAGGTSPPASLPARHHRVT
jgi:hypothetical protein